MFDYLDASEWSQTLYSQVSIIRIRINRFYFLNQNYIFIVFSTKIMALGPILQVQIPQSVNFIRTLCDFGIVKLVPTIANNRESTVPTVL